MLADYHIVRPLGHGNHGEFYLARPPGRLHIDDAFVAVKVFDDHCSEATFRRGVRELRAFASVESPYLAVVYDAVLENAFFYAMEHFPLGSLAAPTRALDRDEILRAVEHAARAADSLHRVGLTHGDIKPANVMLSASGGKLADLGLARALTGSAALTGMPPDTSVEFLDPVLLRGGTPTRSTEIWSLGATLHRALAGTSLYGDLPEHQPLLAIRTLQSRPPLVSPSLETAESELIHDCLGSTGRRLTTAGEVADRICAMQTQRSGCRP